MSNLKDKLNEDIRDKDWYLKYIEREIVSSGIIKYIDNLIISLAHLNQLKQRKEITSEDIEKMLAKQQHGKFLAEIWKITK